MDENPKQEPVPEAQREAQALFNQLGGKLTPDEIRMVLADRRNREAREREARNNEKDWHKIVLDWRQRVRGAMNDLAEILDEMP